MRCNRKSTKFPQIALIFFLTAVYCLLFPIPKALASAEFETAYNVRYEVDTTGITHVTQEVSLVNKLSNVYATRYSFALEAGRIENIFAEDALGPLQTTIERQGRATTINLSFNEQVVGTGKMLKFSLKYDALELASKNGQVWEIAIPKLSDPSQIDSYHLTLAVPKTFGEPAFITPYPLSRRSEEKFNLFTFGKEQLINSGASAAFGSFQIFDFTLFYHLKNPEIVTAETKIAFPPDTAYQRVYYETIDPPPVNVQVDPDGNWLGLYRLRGKEELDIKVSGKVKIFAQPQEYFLKPDRAILEANLKPDLYWEVDDEEIKSYTEKLSTPNEIYNFVIKTFSYDYDRVRKGAERFGAVDALKKPEEAICTEFTDLFITIARAAGIPAREINGYAYTANERLRPLSLIADILHAWPEYWDEKKQVWVPVDPTWGETTGGVDYFSKLDLSHFAFVIHGESSQLPYPAGSYKLEDSPQKDIQVVFGEYKGEVPFQAEVDFDLSKRIFAGIKTEGRLVIKNTGSTAIYNLPVRVESEFVTTEFSPQTLAILPPFGSQALEIKVASSGWFKSGQGSLSVLVGEEKFVYDIKVESIIWHQILPLLGGGFVGIILYFPAYRAGRLLIQKLRR